MFNHWNTEIDMDARCRLKQINIVVADVNDPLTGGRGHRVPHLQSFAEFDKIVQEHKEKEYQC